ncbi:MAG: hypothetical protein IKE91_04225 [Clostridia bacterium]|nr:hypothetical protein [Clostridia bacterium]
MQNIKKLKHYIQRTKEELKDMPSVEAMSLSQFFRYKRLIHGRNEAKKQLKKSMLSAKKVMETYEEYNSKILNNMKISCRQYCRRQALAEYKRDRKLYLFGMIDKKPIHPLLKPVKKIISFIQKPISKSFNSFKEKFKTFKSKTISQSLHRLAIHGCKTFESNCKYMKKRLSTNEYAEYLRTIIKEAQEQLNTQSSNLSFSPQIQMLRNACPNVPASTIRDLEQRKGNITYIR